jgi:hypothetical protein
MLLAAALVFSLPDLIDCRKERYFCWDKGRVSNA